MLVAGREPHCLVKASGVEVAWGSVLEGNVRWNFTGKVSAGVSLCDKCLRGSSVSCPAIMSGRMGSRCVWQPQSSFFICARCDRLKGFKHNLGSLSGAASCHYMVDEACYYSITDQGSIIQSAKVTSSVLLLKGWRFWYSVDQWLPNLKSWHLHSFFYMYLCFLIVFPYFDGHYFWPLCTWKTHVMEGVLCSAVTTATVRHHQSELLHNAIPIYNTYNTCVT